MRSKLLLLSLVAMCLLGVSVHAQSFAITNARIVTVSGSTIDRGTVVVRNGLIDSVGASVSIPADAAVIDVNGSTVYPGFIDTVTFLGVPAPQTQQGGGGGGGFAAAQAAAAQTAAQNPSNSNYAVGLRPEEMLENQIRPTDASLESARNVGITTALTTGRSGIFTGQSVVINLAGDTASEMIVRSPFAQHVQFVTIGGGFPVSLLGTFAQIRQMLNDARALMENQRSYARDPKGMQRPAEDKSLEALMPVLNKQMPVVFNANSEIEIIRALDLIKEYDLNGMIAGGQEAWKVANRLKVQNVPVLHSVNFPRRTAAASPDADPEPLRVLQLRAEAPKGPGRLAAAGVKFAFTSGGAAQPGDFFLNAGRAVEGGLSRDAAIRAMTLGAAELLGVDNRLGSIEKGKIANLVVVRGDVFKSDRFASHVFVDGKLFEPREPTRTGPGGRPGAGGTPAGAPATSVAGTYAITIQIPNQTTNATLNITQQGAAISGTMVSPFGTSSINNGKVDGNKFNFTSSVSIGGQSIEITVNGTVSGNSVTGTIDTPQGNIPFSGTRNP